MYFDVDAGFNTAKFDAGKIFLGQYCEARKYNVTKGYAMKEK
jgi:hypothetical protein